MVGEGDDVKRCITGTADQVARAVGAVGDVAVSVQVDSHGQQPRG
jgi:hypothetical protein